MCNSAHGNWRCNVRWTWKRGRWTVHRFRWFLLSKDIIPRKKGGYLLAVDLGWVSVAYYLGGVV